MLDTSNEIQYPEVTGGKTFGEGKEREELIIRK